MSPQAQQQYQFFLLAQYRVFLFHNLILLRYLWQFSIFLKTTGEKLESSCRSQKGTKYNSQELDKESDLYFFNARHYDPEIARFVTADTVIDGEDVVFGWNRYMYVHGNPVTFKDPSGNCLITCTILVGLGVGIVVDAVIQAIEIKADDNKSAEDFSFARSAIAGAGGALSGGIGFAAASGLVSAGVSGGIASAAGGAAGGLVGSSASQVGQNALDSKPLTKGLGRAALVGLSVGAVTGGLTNSTVVTSVKGIGLASNSTREIGKQSAKAAGNSAIGGNVATKVFSKKSDTTISANICSSGSGNCQSKDAQKVRKSQDARGTDTTKRDVEIKIQSRQDGSETRNEVKVTGQAF